MSWLGEPPLLIFRGIGPLEIGIIGVVVLLLFGATRLPKIGASLGQGLRAFKGAVTGQEVIDLEDDDEDAKKVKSGSKKSE